MRVTLAKDWRRWKKGKQLVGGAAHEALDDGAAEQTKPGAKSAPKPKE